MERHQCAFCSGKEFSTNDRRTFQCKKCNVSFNDSEWSDELNKKQTYDPFMHMLAGKKVVSLDSKIGKIKIACNDYSKVERFCQLIRVVLMLFVLVLSIWGIHTLFSQRDSHDDAGQFPVSSEHATGGATPEIQSFLNSTLARQQVDLGIADIMELATQGDVGAQASLGVMYALGIEGREQDFSHATYWFTNASESGCDLAQAMLGLMYYTGQGVEQDVESAIFWLIQSADQGNLDAQWLLGLFYSRSDYIENDVGLAIFYLTPVANQGRAEAQILLGIQHAFAFFDTQGASTVESNYESMVVGMWDVTQEYLGKLAVELDALGLFHPDSNDLWFDDWQTRRNYLYAQFLGTVAETLYASPLEVQRLLIEYVGLYFEIQTHYYLEVIQSDSIMLSYMHFFAAYYWLTNAAEQGESEALGFLALLLEYISATE